MPTAPAKVQLRKLSTIKPDPNNARVHAPEQIDQIKASILRFGFTSPLIVDDVIRAGNGRYAAAQAIYDAGGTIHLAPGPDRGGAAIPAGTVPVLDVTGWTEEERTAYALADNRIAENATWDEARLKEQLAGLVAMDFDIPVIGFDEQAVLELLAAPPPAGDPDVVPEEPAEPVSALGDVWILGEHRIVCGSSTDPDTVKAVLAGEKPHLMVTDPPYGVEYDASFRNGILRENGTVVGARAVGKVLNDDRADWREAWALFRGDVAYVWHAGVHAETVSASLRAVGMEIRSQIIWAKQHLAIGRGDYHWQHEPCWYAVRKGRPGHYDGGRKQTTLWQIDKPQRSETGHSTQKPVACMRRPIENNSKRGDAIYEPFSGSGTTIIAAELSGRRCYAIELHPPYVDVAVLRWQRLTGGTARLEGGGTFAEVAAERGVEVPEQPVKDERETEEKAGNAMADHGLVDLGA